MVSVHFSLKASRFLVVALKVYLKFLLIALFDNFMFADELHAKALRNLESFVLVIQIIYVENYAHH